VSTGSFLSRLVFGYSQFGFLGVEKMELRTQTMEERLEAEASQCSKDLIESLKRFDGLVDSGYRKQFFEMIETQLQSAFFTGLAKSRSIVRDRQSEVSGTAAEAAKWM
jgi:hypothetical protein